MKPYVPASIALSALSLLSGCGGQVTRPTLPPEPYERDQVVIPLRCTRVFSVPASPEIPLKEALRLQAKALDAYEAQAISCRELDSR